MCPGKAELEIVGSCIWGFLIIFEILCVTAISNIFWGFQSIGKIFWASGFEDFCHSISGFEVGSELGLRNFNLKGNPDIRGYLEPINESIPKLWNFNLFPSQNQVTRSQVARSLYHKPRTNITKKVPFLCSLYKKK